MRQAYYDVLGEDRAFGEDLEQLRRQVARLADKAKSASAAVPKIVKQFSEKWALPTTCGAAEVWAILRVVPAESPLRLTARWQEKSTDPGIEPIVPPTLPPFHYDPNLNPPAMITEMIDDQTEKFRQSLVEQVKAQRRRAEKSGWHQLPRRQLLPADRRRRARRLYRRAVLRESWEQVAQAAGRDGVFVGVDAVRTSVEAWAKQLDVPLPRRRPGRPRRKPGG